MDQQQRGDDSKNKKVVVQDSIKKLKEKLVPGIKYGLLISAIINLSMLVVGCLNVHKCPVNKHIPLFLIATGAIGLMSKFVSYVRDRISAHVQVVYFESALYSVETIFFFLGTYWVYKEFQPSYDPSAGDLFCNKGAYILAFTYITIFYAFIIAIICGFCCFLCCILLITSACDQCMDVEYSSSNPEVTTSLTVVSTKDSDEIVKTHH
ncbi:hypothetical protein Zmor_014768 [Zophobas morio]|uniref:Uncharacterized protein n=1 Tax=Zophobas morio TaxID=2755281 RepID=A0AA38IKS6_9CUCU|nr:hypothetical protein Zmor_014768 [Zophobas morio]